MFSLETAVASVLATDALRSTSNIAASVSARHIGAGWLLLRHGGDGHGRQQVTAGVEELINIRDVATVNALEFLGQTVLFRHWEVAVVLADLLRAQLLISHDPAVGIDGSKNAIASEVEDSIVILGEVGDDVGDALGVLVCVRECGCLREVVHLHWA